MTTLTHTEVAQRAHQLWQSYGCPADRDTAIWLEAEGQLAAESQKKPVRPGAPVPAPNGSEASDATTMVERVQGEMASESAVEYHISPPVSEQDAIKAALQKKEARAPKLPHKTAPKAAPPESGKPLWSKPHSS